MVVMLTLLASQLLQVKAVKLLQVVLVMAEVSLAQVGGWAEWAVLMAHSHGGQVVVEQEVTMVMVELDRILMTHITILERLVQGVVGVVGAMLVLVPEVGV
jgi:hypothetical protein